MTKSGLTERVAELTPHVSKKDTEIVVNTTSHAMTEALKLGERIEMRGSGSSQVKVREAREGRNPKKGSDFSCEPASPKYPDVPNFLTSLQMASIESSLNVVYVGRHSPLAATSSATGKDSFEAYGGIDGIDRKAGRV